MRTKQLIGLFCAAAVLLGCSASFANGASEPLAPISQANANVRSDATTTVAALPVCDPSRVGLLVVVSDAKSPTYNGPLVGGASSVILALCNGRSWRVH